MPQILMPFGKHKGRNLEVIPFEYLAWVLHHCHRMNDWMRRAIEAELERRIDSDGDEQVEIKKSHSQQPGTAINLPDVISRWYRSLCMDYHPDRGGDTKVMQAINDAHDRLKKMVGV
jgi:uncharacterized protein (DUF3820 family)